MEFLLKVSFAIGLALLFYKLVLQQESFFGTNRFYFICCIVLSFILPFIQLPEMVSHQGLFVNIFQPEIAQEYEGMELHENKTQIISENNSESSFSESNTSMDLKESVAIPGGTNGSMHFSWTFWILVLYLFGVGVFILNLLFQVGNIYYKIFKSIDKIQDGACIIVNTKSKQAPCSFFKYIFIHPDDYDFETYEHIIAHEKIHVKQGHSWDLLLAEFAVIVLWFNPLIWMYKREIEKNIEFQTDAILLEKERVNKDKYQMNLLQIAAPDKPLTITTNYNQSLLKQRIMMMNAKKSTLNRYWKYTFMVPLFLGTILLLNEPATSQNVPVAISDAPAPVSAPSPVTSPAPALIPGPKTNPVPKTIIQDRSDMTQGFWYSHQSGNEYCIDFKSNSNRGNWGINQCFNKNEFVKKDNGVFIMTRETGTLQLTGDLDKEVSQGKYEFTKDPSFEQFLAKNNIQNKDQNFMFHLHLHNVDRKYVDFVKGNFNNINGNQLLAMAIHNVDQSYIEEIGKAGFKNLNPDQVVAARIHGVNPTTIKEIQALGFGNLSIQKIIELRIHDVTTAFLTDLKNAGFESLSIDDVVAAKIHGLTPEAINEIKELGFKDLSINKMLQLKIHNVDAAFIQELKTAGFDKLTLDEAVQARIHNLSPSAIKEIKSLGFGDLGFKKMMELKIHGVNASYIKEINDAGYNDLKIDQIISAKIHGVAPSTIKEMHALGFKNINFNKIVEAKIHGVNIDYLNDLKTSGFTDISLEKAIEAKIHGVNSDFIKEAKSRGYDLKTLDEYIKVKIHGLARNSSDRN